MNQFGVSQLLQHSTKGKVELPSSKHSIFLLLFFKLPSNANSVHYRRSCSNKNVQKKTKITLSPCRNNRCKYLAIFLSILFRDLLFLFFDTSGYIYFIIYNECICSSLRKCSKSIRTSLFVCLFSSKRRTSFQEAKF